MGGNYISTVSGKRFYFDEPTPDMIDIEDIAHALSNMCRFTGQCKAFYSVAEHSVLASQVVARPDRRFEALMHDATEAYCSDIARPLKQLLPDYQAVEKRIWWAVAEKFGLPRTMSIDVKDADMAMLKAEVNVLLPPRVARDLALPGEPAAVAISCWSPATAKAMFLQRYDALNPGLPRWA